MVTQTSPGLALITGASTGIGSVYAGRLARRGYDLVLVARNGQLLQSLAARIKNQTGRSVEVITADLSDTQGLATVESRQWRVRNHTGAAQYRGLECFRIGASGTHAEPLKS